MKQRGIAMFGKKKQPSGRTVSYDPAEKTPVIHCSICNGEQVGGLKDIKTGRIEEIMVIRSAQDLEVFKRIVGKDEIPKEY